MEQLPFQIEMLQNVALLLNPNEIIAESARTTILRLERDVSVPELHAILAETPCNRQRYRIIQLLGQIRHRRSIPVLVELLAAPHPMISQNAAQALALYQRPDVFEAMLLALPRIHPHTLPCIVHILGQAGVGQAVPIFIELLPKIDWTVLRYTVIEALGLLGAKEAALIIRACLTDPDPHVRSRAMQALHLLEAENEAWR